jgi:hypothetical protein
VRSGKLSGIGKQREQLEKKVRKSKDVFKEFI